MNIYEEMSKNLYNPYTQNEQSGENIQKRLNIQASENPQTSGLDYALLANTITPFTSQQGGGNGGWWNQGTQNIGTLAGKLGKEGASYASGGSSILGGSSIFSPWNQAASTVADSASSFGGNMLGSALNMSIGYGDAPWWYTNTLGQIPVLGAIIGSMLWPEKDPESPYQYYDPKTRGYAQGIQKGEPLDQFDSASR